LRRHGARGFRPQDGDRINAAGRDAGNRLAGWIQPGPRSGRRPARGGIRARGKKNVTELTDLGLKFKRAKGCFVTELPAEETLIVKVH